MPTIYPLLGDPYEITADEDARMRETYKVEFEGSRKRKEKETADAKHAADYRAGLDAIDKNLSAHLGRELKLENAKTRVRAQHKQDFKSFQACCDKWGLPDLPAPPQAVAVFLSEKSERGAAHVLRLRNSISTIHRATNFADPCDDILVKALVRLIRNEEKEKPDAK
jgi:hypothetical protein